MLRELICNLITIYLVVLAARAVLSWFPMRPDSPIAPVARMLTVITEPVLEPLRRVLPPAEFPIVELPPDHPAYHTLFNVKAMPQITNINNWRRTGDTSEQGEHTPHLRAILDAHGRPMVLMTFNTDMGDSWEREDEDPEFFRRFSVTGYELGVDLVLYALTHC